MGSLSRSKGKRGELELSHELERVLGIEARRGQQFSGGDDSPDIVHSIPDVHIECKRVEMLRMTSALDQAVEDAGDKVPVVMHRKNNQPWLVTVRLDDVPRFAASIVSAVNMSVKTENRKPESEESDA